MIDDATSRWTARFVGHASTEENQCLTSYDSTPGHAPEPQRTQIGRALQDLNSEWIAAQFPHPAHVSPNSAAACFWVMYRFLTSCKTFSRSHSFADIHSPSPDSAMRHQSESFYFAQRGTSHVAATQDLCILTANRPVCIVAQFAGSGSEWSSVGDSDSDEQSSHLFPSSKFCPASSRP